VIPLQWAPLMLIVVSILLYGVVRGLTMAAVNTPQRPSGAAIAVLVGFTALGLTLAFTAAAPHLWAEVVVASVTFVFFVLLVIVILAGDPPQVRLNARQLGREMVLGCVALGLAVVSMNYLPAAASSGLQGLVVIVALTLLLGTCGVLAVLVRLYLAAVAGLAPPTQIRPSGWRASIRRIGGWLSQI